VADQIDRIETYCVELPYKKQINFRAVSESTGRYLVLRIRSKDGAEGVSECVARPNQGGESPALIAFQIQEFFAPILKGRDPLDHNRTLEALAKIKGGRTAQSLIDLALWDLRGRIMKQPVWRLLGGGPVKPVKVSWLVHGDTKEKMVKEAVEKVERGFRSLKIKVWKRSMEDVEMIRDVRKALGDDIVIWVDANSAYTETEARTILVKLADYNVSFIEEPCKFTTPDRMALMARSLPIPILGDQRCNSLEAVHTLVKMNAVGAVSVKLSRTGMSESLKIIGLCEAAGIPMVIGTNSESRLGSMSRLHLRSALPCLEPWPTETHFFEKLGDDVFEGEFEFKDGALTVPDGPGFGAGIDEAKLKRYAV
jgi:L-alanine-DL-glutamate epimerase-like enolase superfamily enzyme